MSKNNPKPHLLLLTYYFPPDGGGGVQRPAKFVKYLHRLGWKITVVKGYSPTYMQDAELLKDIPDEVKVIELKDPFFGRIISSIKATAYSNNDPQSKNQGKRSATQGLKAIVKKLLFRFKGPLLFIYNQIMIPDDKRFWAWAVSKKLIKLCKSEDFDIVMSTSPPESVQILANKTMKKLSIPWVMDLRDPWFNKAGESPQSRRQRINRAKEYRCLKMSDHIVTVTPVFKENLIKNHPHLDLSRKITVITNGFDNDDFHSTDKSDTLNQRLVISHIGTIYSKQNNPETFIEAIEELFEQESAVPSKLLFRFVGAIGSYWVERLNYLNKKYGCIELTGYVSHSAAIKEMLSSDILLIIIAESHHQTDGVIVGKLLEYLRSNKPIWSLSPQQSITSDIVTSMDSGIHTYINDKSAVKAQLMNWLQLWDQNMLPKVNNFDKLLLYDRYELSKNLDHLLRQLIGLKETS